MSVTHLPPLTLPRLRIVEPVARDNEWCFDQVFGALDRLTLIQRDLMMAGCMLKHGTALGPGNAIVDGETLRSILGVAIKTIEISDSSHRDLMLLGAMKQWLKENGDE
jgi:hypothetical protein